MFLLIARLFGFRVKRKVGFEDLQVITLYRTTSHRGRKARKLANNQHENGIKFEDNPDIPGQEIGILYRSKTGKHYSIK